MSDRGLPDFRRGDLYVPIVILLATVAVAAFKLKLIAGWPGPSIFGDELLYRLYAQRIHDWQSYDLAMHWVEPAYPPLYPLLLSFGLYASNWYHAMLVLNILAMAACYSPNPAAKPLGIDFPIDLETGAWRADVWERWLEWDPMRLLERFPDALRSMRLVYLDAGVRDEWCLHLGARLFSARLAQQRIEHTLEEFDDGHMNVSYRYDVSLPRLAEALSE